MLKFFVYLPLCGLMACASGPDEPKPINQVSCRYWLQQCHYKARNRCRRGYTVTRSIRSDKVGGPQGAYKEFRMLFTCD